MAFSSVSDRLLINNVTDLGSFFFDWVKPYKICKRNDGIRSAFGDY